MQQAAAAHSGNEHFLDRLAKAEMYDAQRLQDAKRRFSDPQHSDGSVPARQGVHKLAGDANELPSPARLPSTVAAAAIAATSAGGSKPSPQPTPTSSPQLSPTAEMSSPTLSLAPARLSQKPSPKSSPTAPQPPPDLQPSRSTGRILSSFRLAHGKSRETVRLGGGSHQGNDGRSSMAWRLVRRFVRFHARERAKKRESERMTTSAAQRRAEKAQRASRVRKAHTARKEAAARAEQQEIEQRRAVQQRAEYEAHMLSQLSFQPATLAAAAAAAETRQQARAAAAAALPEATRESRPGGDLWAKYGGPAIETMLDDLDLLDARWLVDLAGTGGVLPRWQVCLCLCACACARACVHELRWQVCMCADRAAAHARAGL